MPGSAESIRPPFPEQHLDRPGLEHELRPRPIYESEDYRPAGKLEGKRALITGGDSGIGRAVAVLFAAEGADVTIVHLPEEEVDAKETAAAVERRDRRLIRIVADVRDPDACAEVVRRCVEGLGGLDILVNNAAFQRHVDRIEDLDVEQWRRTFETNVLGYFCMTKAALAHMPDGGAIVNTGSITGLEGSQALLDYAASKGAIHAFTKSLARQLVRRRIRVNCVAPGPVWTPLNPADLPAEKVAKFGADTPYGRPAQPVEIAPAYVYFASNADSGYVTGEVLTLLGGNTVAA